MIAPAGAQPQARLGQAELARAQFCEDSLLKCRKVIGLKLPHATRINGVLPGSRMGGGPPSLGKVYWPSRRVIGMGARLTLRRGTGR